MPIEKVEYLGDYNLKLTVPIRDLMREEIEFVEITDRYDDNYIVRIKNQGSMTIEVDFSTIVQNCANSSKTSFLKDKNIFATAFINENGKIDWKVSESTQNEEITK